MLWSLIVLPQNVQELLAALVLAFVDGDVSVLTLAMFCSRENSTSLSRASSEISEGPLGCSRSLLKLLPILVIVIRLPESFAWAHLNVSSNLRYLMRAE